MKRCLLPCLPAHIEGNQARTCMFIPILYTTIPPRFTFKHGSLFPVCNLGYHIHQATYLRENAVMTDTGVCVSVTGIQGAEFQDIRQTIKCVNMWKIKHNYSHLFNGLFMLRPTDFSCFCISEKAQMKPCRSVRPVHGSIS